MTWKLPRAHRPLILLNLILLCAVVALAWPPAPATAQNANLPPGTRARGEYTMVSGRTNAGGAHAVFILDTSNQELVALRWDATKQALAGIGYRNLGSDTKSAPSR